MGRAVVRDIARAVVGDFPALPGLAGTGTLETRAVVAGADRPLWLWQHDLGGDGAILIDGNDRCHAFYVLDGQARAGGEVIGTEDLLLVESGGRAEIVAVNGATTLLHFCAASPGPKDAVRGGAVHVRRKQAIGQRLYGESAYTIYADSTAAGCGIWFHSGEMPAGLHHAVEFPHSHSADEIIVVVGGSMILGRRRMGPGTALAVDADTFYGFGVEEEPLHFLNFRPTGSHYVNATSEGVSPPRSETDFFDNLPLRREPVRAPGAGDA